MSWKCKPVVGSSKMNNTFSLLSDFDRNDANFIRWASPPDRVEEDCPSVTYPKPTSCKGLSFSAILVCLCFWKKATASSIVAFSRSSMFLPSYITSSTSFLKRLPPQASQVRCTSAINCISMVTSPSPLHTSQRPPSTLNEKCLDWKFRIFANFWFAKRARISS